MSCHSQAHDQPQVPPAGLRSGMVPGLVRKWGSPAARVSRHVGSGHLADQGQGSMSFSRRVLHMDPCPWSAPMHVADVTGYPLTHPHVLRQGATPCTSGVEWPEGVSPSGSRRSRREPLGSPGSCHPAIAAAVLVRSSHLHPSLLTDRYRPHLCKAVLQPDGLNTDNRSRLVNRLYPQAVHTVWHAFPAKPALPPHPE
jgi:hypothetical protein